MKGIKNKITVAMGTLMVGAMTLVPNVTAFANMTPDEYSAAYPEQASTDGFTVDENGWVQQDPNYDAWEGNDAGKQAAVEMEQWIASTTGITSENSVLSAEEQAAALAQYYANGGTEVPNDQQGNVIRESLQARANGQSYFYSPTSTSATTSATSTTSNTSVNTTAVVNAGDTNMGTGADTESITNNGTTSTNTNASSKGTTTTDSTKGTVTDTTITDTETTVSKNNPSKVSKADAIDEKEAEQETKVESETNDIDNTMNDTNTNIEDENIKEASAEEVSLKVADVSSDISNEDDAISQSTNPFVQFFVNLGYKVKQIFSSATWNLFALWK